MLVEEESDRARIGAFLFEVLQEKERLKTEEDSQNQYEGTISFRTKKEYAVAAKNKKIQEAEHKELVTEVIKQMKKTKMRGEDKRDEKRVDQWRALVDLIMDERRRRLQASLDRCAWCQLVKVSEMSGSTQDASLLETFVGERSCTCVNPFQSELHVQLDSVTEPEIGSAEWIRSLSDKELTLELQSIIRNMKDIVGLKKTQSKTLHVVKKVTAATNEDNFNAKSTSASQLIKRESRFCRTYLYPFFLSV